MFRGKIPCIKYRHLFVTHCDEKRNIFIQLNRENVTSNLGKVSSWRVLANVVRWVRLESRGTMWSELRRCPRIKDDIWRRERTRRAVRAARKRPDRDCEYVRRARERARPSASPRPRRFYLVNCAREHERLATPPPPPFARGNGCTYRERQMLNKRALVKYW